MTLLQNLICIHQSNVHIHITHSPCLINRHICWDQNSQSELKLRLSRSIIFISIVTNIIANVNNVIRLLCENPQNPCKKQNVIWSVNMKGNMTTFNSNVRARRLRKTHHELLVGEKMLREIWKFSS